MSFTDDIATFGEGFQVSLNQITTGLNQFGGNADAALQQAVKIKDTLAVLTGHKTNPTASQVVTAKNDALMGLNVSEGTKNILILVGIVSAGVGIVYLVKGH